MEREMQKGNRGLTFETWQRMSAGPAFDCDRSPIDSCFEDTPKEKLRTSSFIPFLLILVHYHFPSLHFVGHCLESQPRRQERTTTTSLLSQSVAPPFSWAFLQNSTHWNALAIWVDVRDIGGLVGILSWICRGSLRLSSAPEDQLGIVKTKRSYDCTTLFPTEACASISKTYAIKICTCTQKWKALILWTSKRVQEEAMPPFKNAPAHKKEKHWFNEPWNTCLCVCGGTWIFGLCVGNPIIFLGCFWVSWRIWWRGDENIDDNNVYIY